MTGGKVLDLQNGISDRAIHLGEHIGNLTAYHKLNQFIYVQVFRAVAGDVLAVAIYGDIIRNAENFIHFMRNINDCYVFLFQIFDDAEQMLNLGFGQGGGRLVHDYDLAVIRNRLCDFNHLHFCNRQVAHLFIRINIQMQALEQVDAVLTHFFVINDQALARCAAQPEVFADTAFRNRR